MGTALSTVSLAASGLSAIGKGDAAASADMAQSQNALIQAQNQRSLANNAIAQGRQSYSADIYKSRNLADSAEIGRTSAAQTDANARLQQMNDLATILTIRAASGAESGPTSDAILNRTSAVADMDRSQRVGNIMAQVAQDQMGAAYYQAAGIDALKIARMNAKTSRQNADAYTTQAQTYASNADNDQMGGWLGALGGFSSGLAGVKAIQDIKLPTGF